jgi:bacterioferritin-associated ferredoxin
MNVSGATNVSLSVQALQVYNYEYKKGDQVLLTDYEGNSLQEAVVIDTVLNKASKKTQIIKVRVPKQIAKRVAGFKIQRDEATLPKGKPTVDRIPDDAIVCRCERVTAGEIRKWIRKGVRDLNQIKAITRAGMGACGSKTCGDLILQLFKDEGVPAEDITLHTIRPLFIEAPLGAFSNVSYRGSRE